MTIESAAAARSGPVTLNTSAGTPYEMREEILKEISERLGSARAHLQSAVDWTKASVDFHREDELSEMCVLLEQMEAQTHELIAAL